MNNSAPSAVSNPLHGLRRNYLSSYELTFQSVGTLAPSASAAFILPVVFGVSGNGSWLVLAFTTITILLLATQLKVFGQRIASPGAVYAYVSDGLGPFTGVIAAWAIMIAYVFSIATIPAFMVSLIVGLLQKFFEVTTPAIVQTVLIIISILIPWWLAQKDIKLSTRITSVIEIFTLCLIVGLIGYFFWQKGSVTDPAQVHLNGFTLAQFHLGLVMAFFCFGGFETATELGAEAHHPLITIPRVLLIVVLLTGLFFIFCIYGLTDAFQGLDPTLDKQDSPFATLANNLNADWVGVLIVIGIISSMMASSLGCLNACGRVLYAMAHRGLFHASARATHSQNATPHRAIAVIAIFCLIMAVSLFLIGVSTTDLLTYFGSIASFGFLTAYLLVAIAAPAYLRRHGRLGIANIVLSLLTIALLTVPLVGSLYPMPEWPSSILPYIFLVLLGIGVGYFLYVRKTDPERLKLVESELVGPPV